MPLNWKEIQGKWQQKWQEAELGKATIKKNKDKFFMIFAYPGISGFLHVGHMRGFSYTDAICRYERLQEKDVLVQKPYFATAFVKCGPVAVDPSETDIAKGGNAEKNEYTLLKFQSGENYLVAATLRPETIYGQTSIWINPDANYVRVQVDNEYWIVSEEA